MLRSMTNLLGLLALFCTGAVAVAQDDFDVFDSEQIDVDGIYQEPQSIRTTPADRTRQRAEELKRKVNDRVDNTIENMRYQDEQRMSNRLENMFKGKGLVDDKKEDSVSATQAAPAKSVQVVEKAPQEKTVSIGLLGGFSNVSLSDPDHLSHGNDSNNGAFMLELSGQISPRVDIGLGLGYTSIQFDENPFIFDRYYYGGPFDYYRDRSIQGDIFSADIRGKFYFTTGRVRPFVSGLLGLSRLDLDYDDGIYGDSLVGFYDSYGDESYTSTYMNAGVGMGVLINFADSFGLLAQGQLAKNFSEFSRNNDRDLDFRQRYLNRPMINDQLVLENLGQQIEDGTQINLMLGVMGSF